MSKKALVKKRGTTVTGYEYLSKAAGVEEYRLESNGLRVLYLKRPNTGVITTNITYLVGARDEERGVTGIAHMLEHMLFKPTTNDLKKGIESGAGMEFERNTGCILNANTWKDRTTYFFSYPTKYLTEALKIEADRMNNVVLTDEVLKPEQGNVLSEFDMNNGDPHFALAVQMCSTMFHSHPYGHETIGYREDIEDYTAEKLEKFYRNYYRPDNAIMMVVGDVERNEALESVKNIFGKIRNPNTKVPRYSIREAKQEGLRRIAIERPSTKNIVSIGYRHGGFPTKNWFINSVMLSVLTSGPESVLHKLLVDTGKVSSIDSQLEPTSEENLAMISFTIAPKETHDEIESLVIKALHSLSSKNIDSLVKKAKALMITDEIFSRQHSLNITQELTEYVSSGDWHAYAKTSEILASITTKEVLEMMKQSFVDKNMVIGQFKGTN